MTQRNTRVTASNAKVTGSNGLPTSYCDVGMYFGKFRNNSVNIGNNKKKHWMLSGKRWMPSVSGRLDDDRLRKASDVSRKESEIFK